MGAADKGCLRVLLLADGLLAGMQSQVGVSVGRQSLLIALSICTLECTVNRHAYTPYCPAQDQDLLHVRLNTGPLAQSGFLWGGAAAVAAAESSRESEADGSLAVGGNEAAASLAEQQSHSTAHKQALAARVLRERVAPDAHRAALACVFFPCGRTAAADEEQDGGVQGVSNPTLPFALFQAQHLQGMQGEQ